MPKSLFTALALVSAGFGMASCEMAFAASSVDGQLRATPPIILAANGCGRGFFRTADGACIPIPAGIGPRGRQRMLPPPCPRGFLRDPDPARPLCYPVY